MRSFLAAVQFLTCIRFNKDEIKKEELTKSMSLFPLVGLLIGIVLAIFNAFLQDMTPFLRSSIIVSALIIFTRGLHIDGFIDTVDGFGGGKDKEDILRIMKDSNVGAFGVVGAILLITLKIGALSAVTYRAFAPAVIVMPVIGRYVLVFGARYFSYVGEENGLGGIFAGKIKPRDLTIASIAAIIPVLILLGIMGFLLLVMVVLFAYFLLGYFRRKIGGITGDNFGALCELSELLTVILIVILW